MSVSKWKKFFTKQNIQSSGDNELHLKPLVSLLPSTAFTMVKSFWCHPKFLYRHLFNWGSVVTARCGHNTHRFAYLFLNTGEKLPISLPENPSLCIDCFIRHTIPCAWCGYCILPGEPVTLYSPVNNPDFEPRDSRTMFHRPYGGRIQCVGCLRRDCCDDASDRAGFWEPPSGVRRVPTAVEMLLANPGKGMLIHDVRDQKEVPTLFDLG